MAAKKERWVLVVDDDPDVRELIVDDLVDQFDGELRIVEAADGVQATGKLDNQIFDCIITDLKMPKRNGDQFIEWVRESRLNKYSPIVVVSGAATFELAAKYPNVHVVEKPINFKIFGDTIKTQLKLGRLDKRVSADLFNGLLDGTRRYLGKMTNVIPQMTAPESKASNSPVQGDQLVFFSIKGPHGRCDVVFGYSNSLFALFPQTEGKAHDVVALALSSTMVNQFLTTYHSQHRNQPAPKIEQKITLSPETKADPLPALVACGGLQIRMTLLDHPFYLTMINKKS
jgi:CheY-like chemotaxis protein